MKNILFLFLTAIAFFLTACADKGIHDSYSQYHDQTAKQLYTTAQKNIKHNRPDEAINKLEAQSALYPFGAYSEEGLVTLIYAYYLNDDFSEALATASRYLRLYPRGNDADYAYYMKGVISTNLGLSWTQRKAGINPVSRDLDGMKDAYFAFNQLVIGFPQSVYTPDALARMRYIRNLFAENAFDIAQFYYDREAYVAAANRATDVVMHYDGTPAVISALGLMIKSYRKLGMDTDANRAVAILQASYPNSSVCKSLCPVQ